LAHLLDTAAVAELVWDHYLAASLKRMLDQVAGGPGLGRRFFAWLCGVHDCGKATPAFQHMDGDGAAAVWASGLVWDRHRIGRSRRRHDVTGGALIRRVLSEAGWDCEQLDWVWPLVAGHHGLFPPLGTLRDRTGGQLDGKSPAWRQVQTALVTVFTKELGYADLSAVCPARAPSRAHQLQLSGFVVMADWIASDDRYFRGIDALGEVSLDAARARAGAAWAELGLRGGWGELPAPGSGVFQDRFGQDPRPSQTLALDVVRRMSGPGLVVLEAPMGEGKTNTAFAVAEVLAARFGADGVFVGMPTQATSDPMFSRCRSWVGKVGAGLDHQVALLHGKRRFNPEWRELLAAAGDDPAGHHGGVEEDDSKTPASWSEGECPERRAPAEWFLGRLRGLLSPFVVGTIDQLLFAATRTKHVMLRMAGLGSKVVVLDEVHAADIYMSQFLKEGLWWLGQARVPVVLLSATLAPAQRRELVASYLAGATSQDCFEAAALPDAQGYPSVTAACFTEHGDAEFVVDHARSWRDDLPVRVEVLPEEPETASVQAGSSDSWDISAADAAVVGLLRRQLVDGGCVLVIRNTVPRAQATYSALREVFGDDVRLLHGRLHAGHRAERTQECLDLLGPPDGTGRRRPHRLIVVATQLAEQSFDVDADLLITDLAPIDLLLQRLGRVHRHADVARKLFLQDPCVIVTGFAPRGQAPPRIDDAAEGIYGRYRLLRSAALVLAAADGEGWSIPGQVPKLVTDVYEPQRRIVPPGWRTAEQEARERWTEQQRLRAERASPFLLSRFAEHTAVTLDGLHYGGSPASVSEEQFQALVRDGDPSLEVILVRQDEKGFKTFNGRALGDDGEVPPDLVEEVLEATVRLPARLTQAAERDLAPLDAWRDHPWLRSSRALVLDTQGCAHVGNYLVRYDDHLGLVVQRRSP
jgi:CRISPR-associated endonuclease/helicase Cas3